MNEKALYTLEYTKIRTILAEYAFSEVFAKGGEGGIELAKKVVAEIEAKDGSKTFKPIYDEKLPIAEKIAIICKEIYGADGCFAHCAYTEFFGNDFYCSYHGDDGFGQPRTRYLYFHGFQYRYLCVCLDGLYGQRT